jgi:hypothetical protein
MIKKVPIITIDGKRTVEKLKKKRENLDRKLKQVKQGRTRQLIPNLFAHIFTPHNALVIDIESYSKPLTEDDKDALWVWAHERKEMLREKTGTDYVEINIY